MTDYIPLRQYTAGQDPEAEEADDRLPLPSPRRRRRPKSLRNPGVIAGGVAVIFTLFLLLSYSTTGDEQRIRSDRLGSGKGLMEVELPAPGRTIRARHPIAQLIKEAEGKASQMRDLRESIRTLEDAVANYKETFGLDPPEGFDRWSVLRSSSFRDALSNPNHQRPSNLTLVGSNSQAPYHPPPSHPSSPKPTSLSSLTSRSQRICSGPGPSRCSKTRASSG
jgi:hypothetical protein